MSNEIVLSTERLPVEGAWHNVESLELLLYWRSIQKRKWLIIGAALACAALAYVALKFVTPTYRATTTLMIEQGKARLVSIEEVYSGSSPNREHYQTQAEMLKSPALANRVINKLGLASHPEFDPRQRKTPGWLEAIGLGERPQIRQPQSVEEAVLNEFLRRVTVEPIRLTQLVKLSFDSADPKLAASIVNTMAQLYIESDVQLRARITEKATDLLAERLTSLKQNVEDSERALQQYREREGLLDTRSLAQSGASRQLEELTRGAVEARERRITGESNYSQIKKAGRDAQKLPIVVGSPTVQAAKRFEAEAEKTVNELSKRYGPEHPKMAQAQAALDQARQNTQQAVSQVVAAYAKEYEGAVAQEMDAGRAVGSTRGAIQNLNRKEFQLDALAQDLETNRQVYDRFMNRYRETRAATDVQANLVARIIDPAVPPTSIYKPRKDQMVAFGFVLGVILGAIIALLLERMNSSIKSAEEIEEKLGMPALTVVPLLSADLAKTAGRYYLEEPKSVFSEAIRTARTSILLSAIDNRTKVLLVTSSVPGEGKTSFASNLALAHAQTQKTLLVEADLRRPSMVKQLGLDETKPGLSDLFTGTATFAECVQRVEGSSLYVLPSGRPPENPLELLASERFQRMLERIAAACEIVIIDSPPVHLVSDAVLLSTMATGVLFVVKADNTPYPLVRRCLNALQAAGANVVGVTLNQLDFKRADRYYGAYTGYSKEYGSYYGKAAA